MQQAIPHLLETYRYVIIIPIALVEGPLITMICGFFLKLGFISFLPAYLCLVIGDFAGDIGWYWVGHHFGRPFIIKYGKYFSITEKNIEIVENIFHKYKNSILVISKLTMGFGFAVVTLFTAGLVRIPFKRYFILNFVGEFIWTGLLMAVGYFFGNLYSTINDDLGKASIIAAFVVVFLLLIGFGKFIKNKMIQQNS